jgi:hypothetical protein
VNAEEHGKNRAAVRDAISWAVTGRGGHWLLSWEVARLAGVKRRTARFWLAQLEREGVVEQRPTTRRVDRDRDHDGLEWRSLDVVARAE